jgi:hypothetical protein
MEKDPPLMQSLLGVAPGSVSPLCVLYDTEHKVVVKLDAELATAPRVGVHPCTNEATLTISGADLVKFIRVCYSLPLKLSSMRSLVT